MRGFQPQQGRPAQQPPSGEGGGLSKEAVMEAILRQAAERQQQPSAPQAPAADFLRNPGAIVRDRERKAMGYANGGPVRGSGTGTSDEVQDAVPEGTYIMPTDSTRAIGEQNLAVMGGGKKVPVNLSNGEFKLPPEQVHAIGVQALDRMKDATHTPVAARGFAPGARQQAEPPLFFADGGVVDEENARRFVKVPETIGHQPGRQQPTATATPAAPQGMSDAQRAAAIGQIPTGGITAPARQAPAAAPAAPAAASVQPSSVGFMPGTRAVFNESGKAIGDLAGQGRYGAAAGEAARAALAYLPAIADDVIGGAARAVLPGIADAGKQFLGMNNNASATEPPTPAAPAPAAPPVSPGGNSAYGLGSSVPDLRKSGALPSGETAAPPPPADTPTSPTAPPGNEVAPGVYSHGRGQYSDNAAGMGFAPAFTGRPNAQNMAAADALAGRDSQRSMGAVLSAQQPQTPAVQAPTALHSGNSWQARNDLRNLEVAASSIAHQSGRVTNDRGRVINPGVGDNGAREAYLAAVKNDLALRGAQPGLDAAAMRENASLQREGMQQSGFDRRAAMQQAGETGRANVRNAIDQGRLNLDQQVRGFDIRAGERQERLYQKYEAAKSPEEKSAIAQQIRDLSGKQTESPWKIQVTPATKNADGSTTEGSIYRYNGQTGQVERVDAGATAPAAPMPPKDQLKAGQVYQTPRGPARWDGKQFAAV